MKMTMRMASHHSVLSNDEWIAVRMADRDSIAWRLAYFSITHFWKIYKSHRRWFRRTHPPLDIQGINPTFLEIQVGASPALKTLNLLHRNSVLIASSFSPLLQDHKEDMHFKTKSYFDARLIHSLLLKVSYCRLNFSLHCLRHSEQSSDQIALRPLHLESRF
jgi:hypothetical protein